MAESINKIKSGIKINVGASVKTQKTLSLQRDFIWNPATSSCENGKFLANVIGYSVITCDEIIEGTKSIPIMKKKDDLQKKKFLYFTCFFLLINNNIIDSWCYLLLPIK